MVLFLVVRWLLVALVSRALICHSLHRVGTNVRFYNIHVNQLGVVTGTYKN